MGAKVGDRVGAILSAEDGVAKFFGWGVYVGDEIPKEAAGYFAQMACELERKNPKILLDNGKVVFGCECWWGNEAATREVFDAYAQVIDVDIDVIRAEVRASLVEEEES